MVAEVRIDQLGLLFVSFEAYHLLLAPSRDARRRQRTFLLAITHSRVPLSLSW